MTTGGTNNTTITADLPDFASDTIDFKLLSSVAISGVEIFPGKIYTMTLDVDGVGSLVIPTPDGTGDLAWLWEVNLPDGRESNVSISWAALSQDLATILAAAVSTTTPSEVAQLISGKQDKDLTASAGDMAFFDADGNTVDAGFKMSWNATDQTVDIPLNDNVTLQTGQELIVPARNNTGATINNGDIVKFSGSTGTRQIISLAQADTTDNARQIGMATEDIATGTEGFITVVGLVRSQDTSPWDEEDVLYLSPTTPGLKTNVQPTYPQILVEVGIVVRKHPSDGVVFVSAYETASGSYVKAAAAQAFAIQRANHTGTQTLSTISDAGTMAAETATDYYPKSDFSASPVAAEPLKADGGGGITLKNIVITAPTNPTIRLSDEGGTSLDALIGSLEFYSNDTSSPYPAIGAMIAAVTESTFGNETGLAFYTNRLASTPVERVRVTKDGVFGINTTNPLGQLQINVSAPALPGQIIKLAAAQTANALEVQSSAAAIHFAIGATGQIKTDQDTANTNTPAGATAHQLPIYNEAGALLGYIPIYGSAW